MQADARGAGHVQDERVQRRAAINQLRPAGDSGTVVAGKPTQVSVRITGFDRLESHTATSTFFGPFPTREAARCVDKKVMRRVTKNIKANGTYPMPKVVPTRGNTGFYIWSSTLTSGQLILGNNSACGVIVKVTAP